MASSRSILYSSYSRQWEPSSKEEQYSPCSLSMVLIAFRLEGVERGNGKGNRDQHDYALVEMQDRQSSGGRLGELKLLERVSQQMTDWKFESLSMMQRRKTSDMRGKLSWSMIC